MERLINAYERGYRAIATYLVFLPLLAMTVIEFLNAIGRKLFIPFPGTVESVESLLVVSVYFGVALVALENGHVNVTIATERLSPRAREQPPSGGCRGHRRHPPFTEAPTGG